SVNFNPIKQEKMRIRIFILIVLLTLNFRVSGQRLEMGLGVQMTHYSGHDQDCECIKKLSPEPGFSLDLRLNHWRKFSTKGTAVLQFQKVSAHYEYQHSRHQYTTEIYAKTIRYQ